MLLIVLFSYGFATSDSLAPQSLPGIEATLIESIGASYGYHLSLQEHPKNVFLFSCGPFFQFRQSIEADQLWGMGIEAEFRTYKVDGYSGFFYSAISGFDVRWSMEGHRTETIRAGVKLGLSHCLSETDIQMDIEPNVNLGLSMSETPEADSPFEPDPFLELGLDFLVH